MPNRSQNPGHKRNFFGKRKISHRQVRPKNRKRRGNSRYILFFILICLLIGSTGWGLSLMVRKLDFFNIRTIDVTGNQQLEEEFLKELAAEFIGKNLYEVPLRNVSYKFENIIRIERVRIRRVFPNKLKLIVQERTGYIYLKTVEGILVPLDKEKRVLATPNSSYQKEDYTSAGTDSKSFYLREDLPIFHSGLSIKDLNTGDIVNDRSLERVYHVHRLITGGRIEENSISEYYLQDDDIFLIEMRTGSIICLGEKNYPEKLHKLEFVLENVGLDPNTFLDLKFKDQVVISVRR